ncbi:MAG: HAD family hydrolase [Pseudomonadota bacterium]
MTAIKAVLFDKDGTLFDFEATWSAWAGRALREMSGGDEALAEVLAGALGYDLARETFHPDSLVIAGTMQEQAAALAPHLEMTEAEISARLIALSEGVPQQEVVPLGPFLRGLKAAGYALGVATNDAEASAILHLRRAGALPHFDFIAGYDSGHGGKPAPGQLIAFAERLGLAPPEIAMVGDSTHDLHAAREAGCVGVGVLTGLASEAVLAPLAEVVLPSIAVLPDWLAGR